MQAAAVNTTDQVLDLEQIARLRSLRNGTLLPALLRTYREQTGQQLQQITTALLSSDTAGVQAVAHSLKSSSYSIGAQQMGNLSAALEHSSRAGNLAECQALHASLQQAFATLLSALAVVAAVEPA